MDYNDRLYGKIGIEKPVEELLRCQKVQRLRDISLSAVPDAIMVPRFFRDMASRLEHSIGMTHLVKILCGFRQEFGEFRNALLLAAVCHDAGAPPFSHNGEHLLKEMTKMNHEEYTKHILKNSVAEEVIKKYGCSLKEIADIISGKGILGKLMNNTVDIDNADNSERYGFSSGIVGRISNPEKIVKAFMLKGGNLYLDRKYSGALEKWRECRKKIYGKIVYGDANISAGGMLRRALGFVYDEKGKALKREGFLELGDGGALDYMKKASGDAKAIMERAESGLLYRKAAEISSDSPSGKMEELCTDWKGRILLADELSEKLGIQRSDICVQAFRRKPDRGLNNFYPVSRGAISSGGANKGGIVGGVAPRFDIRVFANPRLRINGKNVQKILCGLADMR